MGRSRKSRSGESGTSTPRKKQKKGEKAPRFTLTDSTGSAANLKDRFDTVSERIRQASLDTMTEGELLTDVSHFQKKFEHTPEWTAEGFSYWSSQANALASKIKELVAASDQHNPSLDAAGKAASALATTYRSLSRVPSTTTVPGSESLPESSLPAISTLPPASTQGSGVQQPSTLQRSTQPSSPSQQVTAQSPDAFDPCRSYSADEMDRQPWDPTGKSSSRLSSNADTWVNMRQGSGYPKPYRPTSVPCSNSSCWQDHPNHPIGYYVPVPVY